MLKEEFISKSPVRILEKSIEGGLQAGNIGIIASRKGIGKTSVLVQMALDRLIQGEKVIHVSFNAHTSYIISWYENIFDEIAKRKNLENTSDLRDQLVRNRVIMNAPDTRCEIISRTITTGGVNIARGHIAGNAVPCRGHLECKGLILGGGQMLAIPELDATVEGVDLSHEAAVGKIAQDEIEYLMARGMDESEATSTIVRGFLNVDIMGLEGPLAKAIQDQVEKIDASAM